MDHPAWLLGPPRVDAIFCFFCSRPDDGQQIPSAIPGDPPVASSNPILIHCPKCSGAIQVPPELVRSEFSCPHCGVLIQGPGTWQSQPPPPPRRRPALPSPDQLAEEPPGILLPAQPGPGAKWVWPVCFLVAFFLLLNHLILVSKEDSAVRAAAHSGNNCFFLIFTYVVARAVDFYRRR